MQNSHHMKKLLVVVVVVFAPLMVYSQNDLQKAMEYPVIKGHKYAGVIPISNVDEVPDPTIEYKIVINATGHSKDSSKVNWVIYNIGRYFNLHVAAGIPKENIEIVVAVHAWAFDSFLKNEAYRSEFEIDNPNLAIISELKNAGVRFLVCFQTLANSGYSKELLVPEAVLTLTAQTTLTSYQMKGYALLEMHDN